MSAIDRELLAERATVVDRHLQRVAARLPQSADLDVDALLGNLVTAVGSDRVDFGSGKWRA